MDIGYLVSSISRLAGGLHYSVRGLANHLLQVGINLEVFSLSDAFSSQDIGAWEPIRTHVYPVIGPRSFGFSAGLTRAVISQRFDVVHSQGIWMYPSMLSVLARATSKAVTVVSPRGMLDPWIVGRSHWKKYFAELVYEKRNLTGARCIHALNRAELLAVRSYGIRKPVCVIPNGIDLPNGNVLAISPPWSGLVPPGKKVILYLGRYHPKKGLESFLDAWANIVHGKIAKIDDWGVVLMGWGEPSYVEKLKESIVARGISHTTYLLGSAYGAQKDAAFRSASAFVLPSFSEGLPMSVLEAWSYAVPVLMTKHCNLEEGFLQGAALELEHGGKRMDEALLTLAEMHESERHACGVSGRRIVENRYSWKKIAEETKSMYEWALGGGDKPTCLHWD